MKRITTTALQNLLYLLFFLAALTCKAQTIVGTWQATIPAPPANPRTVLKFSKADDGSLRGTRYQIDQSPEGVPLSSVSFQPPDLLFEQIYFGFSFRGKLSSDGKAIEGIWTQAKQAYPVTFLLATPDTLWKNPGPAPAAPMSPTADPAFEVATIKPSAPDARGYTYGLRTRHFTASNRTVLELLKFVYNFRDRQLEGGSAWLSETRFDISAEPDAAGMPSEEQYRVMLRKLLASRFHLESHIIQRTFPVYALTLEQSPPHVAPSDPEFNHGSIFVKEGPDGDTLVHFLGQTMPMFSEILMNFIPDRQIVDQTGLSGHFDFTLTIPTSILHTTAGTGSDDERASAFIQALHPVGFKLAPTRAPLDVLIIDHIEKPSPN